MCGESYWDFLMLLWCHYFYNKSFVYMEDWDWKRYFYQLDSQSPLINANKLNISFSVINAFGILSWGDDWYTAYWVTVDESESVSAPTESEPEPLSSWPPLGWKTCYQAHEASEQSNMNSNNSSKPFIPRSTVRRSTSKVKDLQNLFLRGGGGERVTGVGVTLALPGHQTSPQSLHSVK